MPTALVPDGFTLKKVTKLQLEAIKDHRKHEDFKAFLSSSGSGKGLGLGFVGIVILILLPFMILAFIRRHGEQNPNMTFTQFAAETDATTLAGGTALYAKAMAGIPETLQNVIIPEPFRDEIKKQTGFDIDVANVFEPLFSAFLQQQKKE
jgi:hypothetical protein